MYSSTILCYRTRPPLSLSFNDRYSPHCSSSSSSSLGCCSCSCSCHCHCNCRDCCGYAYVSACCGGGGCGQHCSTSTSLRFPINPTLLYNRQSCLLQLSGSRRLVLGSPCGDWYYHCRFPVSGSFVDRDFVRDYEIKGRGSTKGRSVERRGRKVGCLVSQESNEIRRLSRSEDADAVISLLSDELSDNEEKGLVEKEKVVRRLEVETTRVYGGGKKNVGLDLVEGNLGRRVQSRKCEVKQQEEESEGLSRQRNRKTGKVVKDRVHRREENEVLSGRKNHKMGKVVEDQVCRREESEFPSKQQNQKTEVVKDEVGRQEESEVSSRQMNRKSRKDGSSCSSYYSISSSGDFESDIEEVKDGMISEEKETRYDIGLKRMEDTKANRKTMEVHRGHREEKESLKQSGSGARSCAEWDWRKKSEKKLADVSPELIQSNEELQQLSKFPRPHELNVERASASYSQTTDKKEEQSVALNVHAKASIDYSYRQDAAEHNVDLQRNSRRSTQVCRTCGSEVRKSSKSIEQLIGSKENLVAMGHSAGVTRIEHKKEGRLLAATAADGNQQETFKAPKIPELDPETSSELNGKLKGRVDNWQESMYTGLTSINARKGEHKHVEEQIIKQSHLKKTQDVSEFSENRLDTDMFKFQSDSKISGKNLTSTSTSYPCPKNQHFQTALGDFNTKHLQEESEEVIHASSDKTVASSWLPSHINITNQSNITSVVQVGVDARITNVTSNNMAMPAETIERPSSSSTLGVTYQETLPQLSKDYDKISSQSIVIPPPSHLVDRGSSYLESTSEMHTQEIQQERDPVTLSGSSEFDSLDKKCEMYGESLHSRKDKDALGSALRLDESSTQFVGEFMEMAHHELSTSEVQMSQSDPKLVYRRDDQSQGSSVRPGYNGSQSKDHDSSSQHRTPASEGPSDEVWHVTNPDKEPFKSEVLEENPSSPAIVRRTGRSLWSVLADIVRLRWGSRSETLGPAPNFAGKSSSNESVSSEAWFSGHDPEDSIDENMKKGRMKDPQKTAASVSVQPELSDMQSQEESPPDVKKDHVQSKILSPSVSEIAAGPNVTSSAFDSALIPFTTEIGSSSISQPLSSLVSPVESTTSPGISKVSLSHIDMIKERVQSGEKLTDDGGMEEKHGKLKQKSLQRKDQVSRDRFDEWEEAYKLESQQRKIDEMFMREALVEAKKAADNWEVPVGAVLVQNGKIIARGCNLVEELRDSTAHAEMICIREASNVLRSWRISDATLYVTLEPCPMCAGAILQARIDTLVWGAPNKLLGADGSWVRLFPVANGGNSSDTLDKSAAPVHPFHPKMAIRRGVLGPECADIMQQFFQLRRRKKEQKSEPSTPPSCLSVSHHPSKLLNKMHDIFHFPFCL